MSNYNKPGSLDGAIDEAVREIMQVDPRPGLRTRVARSINAPRQRGRGFRFGFAAVAVAMVVLASILILRRPDSAAPVPAPQVAETTPAAPVAPITGPQAVEKAVTASTPPPAATPPRRRTAPTPESIFGPRRDRVAATSVPTLPATSRFADPWLEFTAGAAARVALTPITLVPIQIVPFAIQPVLAGAANDAGRAGGRPPRKSPSK